MFDLARTFVAVLEEVNKRCSALKREKFSKRFLFSTHSSKPDDQNTVVGALLKPHPIAPVLDASPFFLRQYLKGHCVDMFDQYALLLTEIVTRIPYQIQKHASVSANFEQVSSTRIAISVFSATSSDD